MWSTSSSPTSPSAEATNMPDLEHQRRPGIPRIPRQPRRLLRPEQGHDLIPAVGAVRDPDVGLDHEADVVGRPGQRLALLGRQLRPLGEALDGRELPDRHEHGPILAGVLRDEAIPGGLVGVLDAGLEVIGQGLVRLAGQDLGPPGHHPAERLQVLDAARPDLDERLELALDAHHVGDPDRLDRIGGPR